MLDATRLGGACIFRMRAGLVAAALCLAAGPAAGAPSRCVETCRAEKDACVRAAREDFRRAHVACRAGVATALCGDALERRRTRRVRACVRALRASCLSCCRRGTATCTLAVCGDGILVGPERCDDGNARDGDGCESSCVPTDGPRATTTTTSAASTSTSTITTTSTTIPRSTTTVTSVRSTTTTTTTTIASTTTTTSLPPACPGTGDGCERQPNFILILTDDQRWDTLAYMPAVMDRLAGEGVTFSQAFAPTPLCDPSRASFLSGRSARHTGVVNNLSTGAFDAAGALPARLRNAGYTTGAFGKYMVGYQAIAPAVPPGWDTWRVLTAGTYFDYTLSEDGVLVAYGDAAGDYATDVLRDQALDFIRASASEPFFVLFAPITPHAPAVAAPRHAGTLAALPLWRPPSWHAETAGKPGSIGLVRRTFNPATQPILDAERIAELEALAAVDEAVGSMLDLLDELGLARETVVLFTSDQGILWGEHWWQGKELPYEESIRIPLVVRDPRSTTGRLEDRMVLNIDIAPTLLELAGVPIPPDIEGRSLARVLAGVDEEWRSDVLLEYEGGLLVGPYAGLRTASWKYISRGPGRLRELYDLVADPHELVNLLYRHPGDPFFEGLAASFEARIAELRTPAAE
jgi:cysteine-rich repeat protein